MRPLGSHFEALQRMIESLTVGAIAERLESVAVSDEAAKALAIMKEKSFDVMGVTNEAGHVVGYITDDEKGEGKVGEHFAPCGIEEVVSSDTPLEDCLARVCERRRLFVLGSEGIEGIVTVADLGKPPVCLMMFGGILLLESTMLAWVRKKYPDEKWKESLPLGRIQEAEKLYRDRQSRNQEIDLADCLQFCDKASLIFKDPGMAVQLGFGSKGKAAEAFRKFRELRDNIAHAQTPCPSGKWAQTVELTTRAQKAAEVIRGLVNDGV